MKKESLPRLLRDFVLIERDEATSMTPGGIALPDVAKDRATRGTVVAVGPGVWSVENERYSPMRVMVGDRVVFPRFANDFDELTVNGEKYLLTTEGNIIGIL